MGIIKEIFSKLKLKELFGITFIFTTLLLFLPNVFLSKLDIIGMRNDYKSKLSLLFLICLSYYFLVLLSYTKMKFEVKYNRKHKLAIKYLKKLISKDEICFLISTFYDTNTQKFRSIGQVDLEDGRKAALENMYIIYRASTISSGFIFPYNIQPYILIYLNHNVENGNIKIKNESYIWSLKYLNNRRSKK